MQTTLNAIRTHEPCLAGWRKLLRHLGKTEADDAPVTILEILDSNGLGDALWCLRAVVGHDREIRLFAVWCARQVQHLSDDPRVSAALQVAEDFANGLATDEQLSAAHVDARAAADTAYAARAYEAYTAARAAADTAYAAAADAANTAAGVVTRSAQKAKLREICA